MGGPNQASFAYYRGYIEEGADQHSIEADGIFDIADYDAIVADPGTVQIATADNVSVPLMTPLGNRSNWFNLTYYQRLLGDDRPFVYYNHLAPVYQADPTAYQQALREPLQKLADRNGVLVFDHSDHAQPRVETQLDEVLAALGISHQTGLEPTAADNLHYHYSSKGTIPGGAEQVGGIEALYDAAKDYHHDSPSGARVFVTPELEAQHVEEAWEFYQQVFAQLSQADPVFAGLTEAEFQTVMTEAPYLKAVYMSGQSVVNFCLLTDVRNCTWMNQKYYQDRYPVDYGNGEVLCCPGIIRNPAATEQPAQSSGQTIGIIGRLARQAAIEPVITFACNSISNRQVPRLCENYLWQGGLGLQVQTTQPDGHQVFQAYELKSAA